MPVEYGDLPFQEAIDFFRDKVNVPTAAWTDLWEGMHARAFSIAGALRDDLLVDFREALDKVVAQGGSLADFRNDFDAIVDKHGWGYNGGRNWRTRVIYETNLRTAYQAGRYQQMQQVTETRPYWLYKHSDLVEVPREQHLAWDGMVLRHDDPFWDTHYPPNGWGCRCSVRTLSERDLKKLGKKGPDKAPPLNLETKTVGIRGPSPRAVDVPKGIDPGWAYNVGEAGFGRTLADDAMEQWAKAKGAWKPVNPAGWAEAGRPERMPFVKTDIALADRVKTEAEVLAILKGVFGDEARFDSTGLPVVINAHTLAGHVDPNRSQYIPLLADLVQSPYETWLSFDRHEGTGKIALRYRFVKGYDLGKGRYLLMSANGIKGRLEGWTFLPTSDRKYIQRQRVGELIYASDP